MERDPIDAIEWMHHSRLNANDYNPNVVFSPELRLLERSIAKTGWVQPVMVTRELTIIDGFHRWNLTRDSKTLHGIYAGNLPVAVLDVDRAEGMLMTIRMNRAKGTHTALKMADIVRELIDTHGLQPAMVATEIGASGEEVRLLYTADIFKQRNLKDAPYGRAWVPHENKND